MKNIKLIYILGVILSLVTISCKNTYDEDETFVQGNNFRIVNAATGFTTAPFIVYQGDNLLLSSFLYGTDSNYFRSASLNSNVNIKVKDNNNVQNTALTINDSNGNNESVTYFLINSSATASNLEFVKVKDDVAQPDFDKVKVRVANMVSNLPSNVDLLVKNKNQVIVTNVPFKSVSNFITVDKTDKIEIVFTGTTTVVKAFNFPLTSKGVYTYVLGGSYTGPAPLFVNQFSNTL